MAEIIIEIANEKNRGVTFGPTRQKLRGRWTFAYINGRFTHEAMKSLSLKAPVIPGQCIAVDPGKATCRVFDPLLSTERGQEVFAEVKPVIEKYASYFQCGPGLTEEVVRKNCSYDELKTWLYYMRRMVDAGQAEVVTGSMDLPSLEKIKSLPGRRERGFFNNSLAQMASGQAESAKWSDSVPIPSKST